MNFLPLAGFYFRNSAQIEALQAKLAEGSGGDRGHAILLAWIQTNLAIAQRIWPDHAPLISDLNSTLAEVIGK